MRRIGYHILYFALLVGIFLSKPEAHALNTSWASSCDIVPNCLGINLHLENRDRAKLQQDFVHMRQLGFRIVRVPLYWEWIEYRKGYLDFTNFDRTIADMNQRGLRPMLILSNVAHSQYGLITNPATQQSFVNYAKASAERYKNYPIIWELWNEPNTSGFWPPKPDATQYMALAKAVIPTMRAVNPNLIIVGPAALRKKPPTNPNIHILETDFIKSCFQKGFSNFFNGVSFHPYRMEDPPGEPETMSDDYQRMFQLIASTSPVRLPLINSERGYDVGYLPKGEEQHGNFMVRSYLVALMNHVPFFTWYIWHDTNPKTSGEGMIRENGSEKPAATKLRMLTSSLNGFRYTSRLSSGPKDYLLLFSKNKQYKVAAWTTNNPHTLVLYPSRTIQLSQSPAYYDFPTTAVPKGR